MKRNAIIRIVLYGLALVILLSVDQIASGISSTTIPLASDDETVSTVVDVSKLQELEIDWAAGSITILADEYATQITVIEPKMTNEKHQMRVNTKDGKLSVEFREKTIGTGIDFSKELMVVVPASWQCQELSINAAAASVQIEGLKIAEAEVNAASGVCNFLNCNVGTLDVETASGDVTFDGILNNLEFDAVSANCHLILAEYVPISIEMESMSGDLILELPEDAGFALQMDALSGEFHTDFDVEVKNGKYRAYGKHQECMLNLSALSGNVTVLKHTHTEDCIGRHKSADHHN